MEDRFLQLRLEKELGPSYNAAMTGLGFRQDQEIEIRPF
jgi:hypothetical protein